MKIQLTRKIKLPPYLAGGVGHVLDLPDREARRLVREGWAALCDPPESPPRSEPSTAATEREAVVAPPVITTPENPVPGEPVLGDENNG